MAAWPSHPTQPYTLIHGGSHSDVRRTNVSALFSYDDGVTWRDEQMVWQEPKVGGYVAAQAWAQRVALVFENDTCSISIGVLSHE